MGKEESEEEIVTCHLFWKERTGEEVDRGVMRGMWVTELNMWTLRKS